MLNICCLCPTYGRPSLCQNVLAMFLAQHYPDENKRLLFLDDGDQITGSGPLHHVISSKERRPSYCYKYGEMDTILRSAQNPFYPWVPDAYALFEDDDIYGPFYLLSHDLALKKAPWSHPLEVLSLYSVDTRKGQLPIRERSAGRFWSSAASRVDFLTSVGGFITSGRADADQLNLQRWGRLSPPAHPDLHTDVQWVYGWGRAFHCSGLMTDGVADTSWYLRHRKTETGRIDNIQPVMDEQTHWLYKQLWCHDCKGPCTITEAAP